MTNEILNRANKLIAEAIEILPENACLVLEHLEKASAEIEELLRTL